MYLKVLADVPAYEVLAHRIVWSSALLVGALLFRKELAATFKRVTRERVWGRLVLTAVLIGANWLTFIYAVATGRTVEASLGYFANPLFMIALGVVVLRERLRIGETVALLIATGGLIYQIVLTGQVSWISLVLPATFSDYALIRKQMPVGSFAGLALETVVLLPISLAYLGWAELGGLATFGPQSSVGMNLALMAAGLATAVPLLLFTEGSRRLPLQYVGFLQYMTPSIHLVLGVYLFNETLSEVKLNSFMIVWAGLAVMILDQVYRLIAPRLRRRVPTPRAASAVKC